MNVRASASGFPWKVSLRQDVADPFRITANNMDFKIKHEHGLFHRFFKIGFSAAF